jgi:hypothetical protein
LGQVTRHLAVRNFDAGDGIWHFRAPVWYGPPPCRQSI